MRCAPPTPIPGEGTSLDQRERNDGIVQVDLLVLLHRLLDQLDHRLLYGPLSLPKGHIYRLDPQTGDTTRFFLITFYLSRFGNLDFDRSG